MEINLDLKNKYLFNKHYKFCVGSGHAPLALRKDYCEQLKFIHDTLGIERVRFHGIFSDDMTVVTKLSDILPVIGSERFYEYNFENIGKAYDNVLEAGMKPFVELGFMPKHLASNKDEHILFYYGGYSSMPKDDIEWQGFIQEFIRFLLNRYGKEEVETWFFEVWNEPDLPIFFGGTQEDYFHLYDITARAIKAIDEKLIVGGPATSRSLWIKEFVSFIEENEVPCDFISTHQYAGDPIGHVEGMDFDVVEEEAEFNLFSNPNILKGVPDGTTLEGLRHVFLDKSELEDIRNDSLLVNAKEVKKNSKNRPLYYTEWNENAIFSAYTNDTRKVSAYLVMTALKMANLVEGSSVWCFSDIFEEFHMFSEEFHGGFGLLSHNGIPKPSYYAMKFLNEIGDYRFEMETDYGEITCGAFSDNDGNIQLLVTRQNMKNLALDSIPCDFTLNFNAKNIFVKKITEDSGNPLKLYEEMGLPRYLSKKEIEKIKDESQVKEEALPFLKVNSKTQFQISLGVNDTYLIKLYKE